MTDTLIHLVRTERKVAAWLMEWWKLFAASALAGVLIAFAAHPFLSTPTFSIRVDLTLNESPLGSPTFVNRVSQSVLQEQLGARARVLSYNSDQISIVRSGLDENIADERFLEIKNSVSTLQSFLNTKLLELYDIAQQDVISLPNNPAAYRNLQRLKPYVDAHEAGLFEQVQIRSASITRTSLPLFNRVVIGLLLGLVIGAAIAMAITVVRRRSQTGTWSSHATKF